MIVTRIRPPRRLPDARWGELDQMRRDMAHLAETLLRGSLPEPGARMFPLVNVTQDDENFYVRAEIPGARASDLKVSAEGNVVSISGKRDVSDENGSGSYHRRERSGGVFSRSIQVPSDFDRDRIKARYANGVLTLTLPLAERMKPRQIPVKTG